MTEKTQAPEGAPAAIWHNAALGDFTIRDPGDEPGWAEYRAAAQALAEGDRLRALISEWRTDTEDREGKSGYERGVDFAFVKAANDLEAVIAAANVQPKGVAAAVPMCSEQAVLHALTMARSEAHQQGDAALWQAFGRAMWRQFNAMLPASQAPAPAPGYPHERMDAIATARYRVVKQTTGFWDWGVFAGDGALLLYKGHKSDCELVARRLAGAFLDGGIAASALLVAAQPAPQQPLPRRLIDGSDFGWTG